MKRQRRLKVADGEAEVPQSGFLDRKFRDLDDIDRDVAGVSQCQPGTRERRCPSTNRDAAVCSQPAFHGRQVGHAEPDRLDADFGRVGRGCAEGFRAGPVLDLQSRRDPRTTGVIDERSTAAALSQQ